MHKNHEKNAYYSGIITVISFLNAFYSKAHAIIFNLNFFIAASRIKELEI